MIEKIKRMISGGPKPVPSFAERALLMSEAHKTFMEHARQLHEDIAGKKADIEAAQSRLAALHQEKPT